MRVFIAGIDGYIGYALALHLLKLGHDVAGLDDYSRREYVAEVDSDSLTPILRPSKRKIYLKQTFPNFQFMEYRSVGNCGRLLGEFQPDTIVHLAEQPSAPFSMIDSYHAAETQAKNVIGTLRLLWEMREYCPEAHLVKLGTMGEYGTPPCDIPEGNIPIRPCLWIPSDEIHLDDPHIVQLKKSCPMKGLPFPRQPGSFYHLSKVHDTHNIIFACKTWGLRSTDIMQGVVYGLGPFQGGDELTRFDYDEYFGTVINRFIAQALIDMPLTVYGKGFQQRGFLPLSDSLDCLTLAIENPPKLGEYRVFNQFEQVHSIMSLAKKVRTAAANLGLDVKIDNIPNPRTELDDHYYNPTRQKLFDLGYQPSIDIDSEIASLLSILSNFRDRIQPGVIMPKTTWK